MNVRLVDVRSEIKEDVRFGTCEFCFSTGTLQCEYLVFEDSNGNELEVELGGWDWGDYFSIYDIDNIVDFASFINDKNINTLDEVDDDFHNLYCEYMELEDVFEEWVD